LPYAELDANGQLLINSPTPFFYELPFRRHLATVRLMEEAIAQLKFGQRAKNAEVIFEKVFERLVAEVKDSGATPIVFYRREFTEEPLLEGVIQKLNLPVVRCVDHRQDDPKYQLPGDPHPGEELNASWARCLYVQLQPYLMPNREGY